MAKWLRREHSDAEKQNGFRLFLNEHSYNRMLAFSKNFKAIFLCLENLIFFSLYGLKVHIVKKGWGTKGL